MRKIPANCQIIAVLLFLSGFLVSLQAQNYIGMHKDEIAPVLRKDHPDFRLDRSTVNHAYKYLKFVDDISEQTVLFFLSEDDVCTYVRWMSDYANLNDMISILDNKYSRKGDNNWTYRDKAKLYSVTLKEEEWYFTVNIKEK